MSDLVVHEIFTSLQGETTAVGRPCTFVRLTACDLRCTWCDTVEAFTGGQRRSIPQVLAEVRERSVPFVTVTGGEPLLQERCPELVAALLDAAFDVQVETGGHRDVSVLDRRARIILDLKPPDSGQTHRMLWENLSVLRDHDEVKMVVASRRDYEWAREVRSARLQDHRGAIILQAATGVLAPAELAAWIVADRLDVRFGIQLHAFLWPGRKGV